MKEYLLQPEVAW